MSQAATRRKKGKATRDPKRPEEAPLTPFIDIIFQVLIFFMLSMKFKEKEGHLLSMLPDRGIADPIPPTESRDVRIYVCADTNGRMDQHIGYKEKHQDFVLDQKQAGRPVGDVCRIQLELRNDQQALL